MMELICDKWTEEEFEEVRKVNPEAAMIYTALRQSEKKFQRQLHQMEQAIKDFNSTSIEIKEAFIIEELQKYVDTSDPPKLVWNEQVRVRLQEKKDWQQQLLRALDEFYKCDVDSYHEKVTQLLNKLEGLCK
jgi:hypothetical protein